MPRAATAPAKEAKTDQSAHSVSEKPEPVSPASVLVPEFDVAAHHQEIAQVSYRIWLERADGPGSAEQDWLKAVSEVRAKYTR